jgi:hypothetical protein
MSLRLSRNQCEATLNLAGCEHVWVNSHYVFGYCMRKDDIVWKPTYTLGRRNRRLASFTAIKALPAECVVREGWTGWRIDELRMAVKQIVQGESLG